ncbi:MAG: InlB B-repeat-containing protein [Lachnospiraceae bacterium]|nr:InlB B-repeat-containing protein [Lachnospiraceae bacterium]
MLVRKKFKWKRFISLLLVIALTIGNLGGYGIDINSMVTQAAESENIKINGETIRLGGTGLEGAKTFPYGTVIRAALESSWDQSEGTTSFYYGTTDTNPANNNNYDWHALTESEYPTEIGSYYIAYMWEPDDKNNEPHQDISGAYAIKIVPAQIAKSTGLEWTQGTTATWSNTDSSKINQYSVDLYKDGEKIKTTTTKNTQLNFSSDITSGGKGEYTYTVNATPKNTTNYIESGATEMSDSTYSVEVQVEGLTGVASVTPATSQVLIPGSASNKTMSISATMQEGFVFDKWEASAEGVTFANKNNASTTVTLGEDYAGGSELTLTAKTVDTKAPTIQSFQAGTGNDRDKLYAVAKDDESGIKAYAFSSETNAANVDNWTEISDNEVQIAEAVEFTKTADASGEVYFYVKDSSGNVTKSEDSVDVFSILYKESYVNDNEPYTVYVAGNGTFALPSPAREGYEFLGWFENEESQVSVGTSLALTKGQAQKNYELTAKWAREQISVTQWPQEQNFEYDGTARNLSVTVGNTSGTITYQWFKDGEELEGATAATYGVRDLADSGDYKVRVSVTVEGDTIYVDSPVVTVDIWKNAETSQDVTVELSEDTFVYNGSAFSPEVIVKDKGVAIPEQYYEVTPSLNTEVGPATVSVEFSGRYHGTVEKTFQIVKAQFQPAISMSSNAWRYGTAGADVVLTNNVSGGAVTYVYKDSQGRTLPARPIDAGEYTVRAVIAATANYEEATSNELTFTIEKRNITITANSHTWAYDGNIHTDTGYSMTGELAYADNFKSIIVSGSVSNAGNADNVVLVTFSDATNSENYNLTTVKGTLTVTPAELVSPENADWSASNPGRAEWIAVSRKNLSVEYEVELYRANVNGSSTKLGDTVRTTSINYNFADRIKADAEELSEQGAVNAGYFFRVKAIPVGGTNKDNYSESGASQSGRVYTGEVRVVADNGLSHITVGDEQVNGGADGKVILIQGESIQANAVFATGYEPATQVWTTDHAEYLSVSSQGSVSSKITLNKNIDSSVNATLYGHSSDENPIIGVFEAESTDNNKKVEFTIQASDTKAISAWAVTTKTNSAQITQGEWTSVAPTTLLDTTLEISTQGTYYLYVKDNSGNIVKSEGIGIYAIHFSSGEGEGSMPDVLKIQGKMLTLPSNVFTKSGFYFTGWKGVSGRYSNAGKFAADREDTLVAQWSDKQYAYTVNYYYMDTDGNYPTEPEATATFNSGYGTVIGFENEIVAAKKTGFSLDAANSTPSIEITDNEQVLNLYYKRNTYTLTFTYKYPGDAQDTVVENSYRYGAAITELEKPTYTGYIFAGWTYGNVGSAPETMPAHDVSATGRFNPDVVNYQVNYYLANLSGEGDASYTRVAQDTMNAYADSSLNLDITRDEVREFEGFTTAGVTVTTGVEGGVDPGELQTTAHGTVLAGNTVHVNYYYTRNTYNLFLKVYKQNRKETSKFYSHSWTVEYGAPIDADYYANYQKDTWRNLGVDLDGLQLAPVKGKDWSTGVVPGTMPAGDLTINRDFVSTTFSNYTLEVYQENAQGNYVKNASLVYEGSVGSTVTIGNAESDTIKLSSLSASIPYFSSYELDEDNANNVLEGEVKPLDETPTVLRIYLERKVLSVQVRYYYKNSNYSNVQIATVTKTGKWGETYSPESFAFFKGDFTPDAWEAQGYTYSLGTSTIDGTPVTQYDFLNNGYVVNYDGYYSEYGSGHWTGKKYDSPSDVNNDTGSVKIGQNNSGYVNVYYTKVAKEQQYCLNVKYNASETYFKAADYSAKRGTHWVTLTDDAEKEYRVRVANKAYVLKGNWNPPANLGIYEGYPGLAGKNYTYQYEQPETPKDGFYTVNINGSTYYAKDETENGDTVSYVYVMDDSNQFYAGNRIGYSLGSKTEPYKKVQSIVDDYKTNYGGTEAGKDPTATALYIYGTSQSGIFSGTSNVDLTFSFNKRASYTISHVVNGNACVGHSFVDGTHVTREQAICNLEGAFPTREGYSLNWYKDTGYQNEVTDFTITGNVTFYGRYERAVLKNKVYASYKLANSINVAGQDTYYITGDNFESAVSEHADDFTVENSSYEGAYVDGLGRNKVVDCAINKYYYKGSLVLLEKEIPAVSYSELTVEPDDYVNMAEGYHYDDTQPDNQLHGYCQTTPAEFAIFYARQAYELKTTYGNTKVDNSQIANIEFDSTQTLPVPSRYGYRFAGWQLKKWNEATSQYVDFTAADKTACGYTENGDHSVTFNMPENNVWAVAKWTPDYFDQVIYHYFQSEQKTYNKDVIEELEDANSASVSVRIGSDNMTGIAYYNGASINDGVLGVKVTDGNKESYYKGGEKDGDVVLVDVSDLAVVKQTISTTDEGKFRSEDEYTISDYCLEDAAMFSFSHAVFTDDSNVTSCTSGSKITAVYGMGLDYFYERTSDYSVKVGKRAVNADSSGLNVSGSGVFYHGENASLIADTTSGYDFLGWFDASDVLKNYDPEAGLSLEGYELIDNIQSAISEGSIQPVTTNATYAYKVLGNKAWIALTKALSVPEVSAVINGTTQYTYGYKVSSQNALSVGITSEEEAAVGITDYQWYEVINGEEVELPGEVSSVFAMPEGKRVGQYTYRCKVTVSRKDNGLSTVITSSDKVITVAKAALAVSENSYTGTYDGNNHSATVSVTTAGTYKVYYSEEALNESNYKAKGSLTAPAYKDVKMEAGEVVGYPVYYYAVEEDANGQDVGNYNSVSGCVYVTINPKKVTVVPTGAAFTKDYDGKAEVTGSITDSTSDYYRLANGNYVTVTGILPGDTAKGYVAAFNATFNTPHVSGSSKITLNEFRVVYVDEGSVIKTVNNYAFESAILTLSGYITSKEITAEWSAEDTFTYDGTVKAPSVELANADDLPDDNIEIEVSGGQKNVGHYTAHAELSSTDYLLDAGSATHEFSIVSKATTVSPTDNTLVYNGQTQYLTSFEGTDLPEGYTIEAGTNRGAKDVGNYTVTAQNIKIYDEEHKDATDNFEITAGNGTLTIAKRAVTIDGISFADKTYDGNVTATPVSEAGILTGVTFANIIEGDELSFLANKVTGQFVSKDAGDRAITITFDPEGLSGEDSANYYLDTESNNNQRTANATIAKKSIDITPNNTSVVYGEEAVFSASNEALVGSENFASLVSGTITYKVAKEGETPAVYSHTMNVGEYEIIADVTALSATNYVFTSTQNGTLTITKRHIAAESETGASVDKTYDGNTDATDSLEREDYQFTSVDGDDASGVVNGDDVNLSDGYSAEFEGDDVGNNHTVTVTPDGVDNENYELDTDHFTIDGHITRKPLTIKADAKTITYGAADPTYTATFTGLTAEDSNNKDTLFDVTFSEQYDNTDPAKRNAGDYVITPSCVAHTENYAITYENGTLKVNKKQLTVKANNITDLVYGNFTAGDLAYTGTITGFAYDDTQSVITGNPVYECKENWNATTKKDVGLDTVAGTYEIRPNVSGLSATNYTFTATKGNLTIAKALIDVQGIVVDNKTYDGTVMVLPEDINTTAVEYRKHTEDDSESWGGNGIEGSTGITANDKEYLAEQGTCGLIITGEYASKNAGSTNVNLTVGLNEYMAARYELVQKPASVGAVIDKKALTVRAKDTTVKYGLTPSYSVTYSGFVSGESEKKAGVLTGTVQYACDYRNTTPVTTAGTQLPITPSGYSASNYDIQYVNGTLTVAKNQLAVSAATWSQETPGTITYPASAGIGDVAVKDYTLTLYKKGATETKIGESVTTAELSHSFLEEMRAAGAGQYIVKVVANPDTENNENNCNVLASNEKASGTISAANVIATAAEDAVSQAGLDTDTPVEFNSAASEQYVVIAGEQNIPIKLNLKNATGYKVEDIAAADAEGEAVDFVSVADGANKGEIASSYSTTFNVAKTMTATDDIHLVYTLGAKAATLSTVITVDKEQPISLTYGYGNDVKPTFTTIASVVDDNVTVDEYDYTYTWKVNYGAKTEIINDGVVNNGNVSTFVFPSELAVRNDYNVFCTVKATRKDNGQSKANVNTDRIGVQITKAAFLSSVSIESWAYGEARKTPSVSLNPGNGVITYEYREAGSNNWTTNVPTNVGNYQVKANIAETPNYTAYTTSAVDFSITQATLTTPEEPWMEASGNVPYGLIKWNRVPGVRENADAQESASAIDISYRVKLYYKEGSEWTLYKTYNTDVNATQQDVLADINAHGNGIYKYTITAISDNASNCADSAENEGNILYLNSTVATIDEATSEEATEKTYDGAAIALTAGSEGTVTSYQWYKDAAVVTGATSATYNVRYVEDNGVYVAKMQVTGAEGSYDVYTICKTIHVTPRALTLTAATAEKTYDGTALTAGTYSITDGSLAEFDSVADAITCEVNGTVTTGKSGSNTADNKIENLVIKRGEKVVFAENGANNNYTVTKTDGLLTVHPRSLGNGTADCTENITATMTESAVYTGEAITPEVTITDKNRLDAANVEIGETLERKASEENDNYDYDVAYENNVGAGTATVTITGNGNYTGSIVRTFDIAKATTDITVSSTAQTLSKTYDKTPVSAPVYTYSAQGRTGAGIVSVTYYAVEGENETELDGAPANAGDYRVKISAAEGANFNAPATQTVNFTIAKRPVTLTATSDTKPYGSEVPSFTANITAGDVIEGDDLAQTAVVAEGTTAESVPQEYAVSVQYAEDPNYAVTCVAGTYTITKADQIITAEDVTVTYDEQNHGYTATVAGAVNGLADNTGALSYYVGDEAFTGKTNAGTYEITVNAAETDCYNAATTTATLTIEKAATSFDVTSTSDDLSKVYDGNAVNAPEFTYSAEGKDGAGDVNVSYYDVSGEEVVLLNEAPADAGSYKAVIHATAGVNFEAPEAQEILFTISKRPITFTATGDTKPYGSEVPSFEVNITLGEMVGAQNLAPVATTEATRESAPGEYDVTISYASNENYDVTCNNATYTITKAQQTITMEDASVVFDGDNHTLEATVLGANNNLAVNTGALSYYVNEEAFTGASDVGVYEVTAVAAANDYYEEATENATLTITKAPTNIDVTSTAESMSRIYDGTEIETPEFTYSGTGYNKAGEVSVTYYAVDGEGAETQLENKPKDAGSYKVVISAAESDNMFAAEPVSVAFTINKRPVELRAADVSRPYGSELPEFEVLVGGEGIVAGDSLAQVATVEEGTNEESAPGSYSLTVGFTSDDNYVVTTVPGTYTITKATQVITAEDKEVRFDGQPHSYSATVAGAENGRTEHTGELSYFIADEPFAGATALARYTITVRAAGTDYYEPAETTATLAIVAGHAEITMESTEEELSKIYDGTPVEEPEYTYNAEGKPGAGEVVVTYYKIVGDTEEELPGRPKDAGDYRVEVKAEAGDSYSETEPVSVNFTITKRAVTLKAADAERAYGSEIPEFGIEVATGSIVEGDDLGAVATTVATRESAPGEYGISVGYTANSNYDVTTENGTYTVTQADQVINAEDMQIDYDGLAHALSASVVGAENNSSANTGDITYELDDEVFENATVAGVYRIKVKAAANTYYKAAEKTIELTIVPAATTLTVTSTSEGLSKEYDGQPIEDIEYVYSADGEEGAGEVNVSYFKINGEEETAIEGKPVDAGEYKAVVSASAGTNYAAPESQTVNFTITKRAIEYTVNGDSKPFGSEIPEFAVAITAGSMAEGESLNPVGSTTATSESAPAEYPVTVNYTANSNYDVSIVPAVYTITKADQTITAEDVEIAYDGQNHAYEATVTGAENGLSDHTGEVTYLYNGQSVEGVVAPGTYTVSIQVAENEYYNAANTTATLVITKANAEITINSTSESLTKEYDGMPVDPVAYTYSAAENEGIGEVSVTYYKVTEEAEEELPEAPVAAGDYKAVVRGTEGDNFNAPEEKSINFAILKRQVTITATSETKPYGSEVPAFDAEITTGSMVGEETLSPVASTEATSESIPGEYAVTVSYAANPNYEVTCVDGTYTVEKAEQVISVDDLELVYDGENHMVNATVEGKENHLSANTGELSYYVDEQEFSGAANTGVYNVVVKAAATEFYDAAEASATITITAADATIELLSNSDDLSKKYDGEVVASPEYEYSANDKPGAGTVVTKYYKVVEGSEDVLLDGAPKNAGEYKAVISAVAGDNFKAVEEQTVAFSIAKRDVSLNTENVVRTYASEVPEFEVTVGGDGMVGEESLQPVATTDATIESAPDNYDITISYTEDDNYNVTVNNAVYTVEKGTQIISADDVIVEYDGEEHCVVGTAKGSVTDSDENTGAVSYKLADETITGLTAPGTYDITVVAAETDYYNAAQTTATLTIEKAATSISISSSADDISKVYDGTPVNEPVFTYSANGKEGAVQPVVRYYKLLDDDVEEPLTGAPKDYGKYKAVVTCEEGENYKAPETQELEFIITKRTIALKANNVQNVYGNDVPEFTVVVSSGEIAAGDELDIVATTEATKESAPGQYPIIVSHNGNENYNIHTINGEYTIIKRTNDFVDSLTVSDVGFGTNPNPSATGKYGNVTYLYSEAEDGEYTSTIPTQIGRYYVKAVIDEGDTYFGIEGAAKEFLITKTEQNGNETTSVKTEGGPAIDVEGMDHIFDTPTYTEEMKELVRNGGNIEFRITSENLADASIKKKLSDAATSKESKAVVLSNLKGEFIKQPVDGEPEITEVTDMDGYVLVKMSLPAEAIGRKDYTLNRYEDGAVVPVAMLDEDAIADGELPDEEGFYLEDDELYLYTKKCTPLALNYSIADELAAERQRKKEEEAKIAAAKRGTLSLGEVDKMITSLNTDKGDPKNSTFRLLRLRAIEKKKALVLKWTRYKKADGYIIYGSACGKKMKYVTTINTNKKTKLKVKKLKANKYYKYIVFAYKNIYGEKRIIASSKSAHACTRSKKKANPTKIKSVKKKLTLKKGKKFKFKPKYSCPKGKKVHQHIAIFRYESTNEKIAKVNKKGKLTARKKGTCTIYVYTQNGLYKKVKVRVK